MMRRALRVDSVTAIVLGLTAIGLALRFWGIQHGLPHPTSRPDEREVLDHTAQFATWDLNPRWFIYPPFYFHVTWLWDELVLAVWRYGGRDRATSNPGRTWRRCCSAGDS
jgi:hypothetical protein